MERFTLREVVKVCLEHVLNIARISGNNQGSHEVLQYTAVKVKRVTICLVMLGQIAVGCVPGSSGVERHDRCANKRFGTSDARAYQPALQLVRTVCRRAAWRPPAPASAETLAEVLPHIWKASQQPRSGEHGASLGLAPGSVACPYCQNLMSYVLRPCQL